METQVYCFVGSECQIGDRKLEKFGTEISLDAAAARNALEGGAQLCPKASFDFTEQEVSLYPFPAHRANAPEAFTMKHREALRAVAAHLAELKGESHV